GLPGRRSGPFACSWSPDRRGCTFLPCIRQSIQQLPGRLSPMEDIAGALTSHRSLPRPAVGLAFGVVVLAFWPSVASFPAAWAAYGWSHGWLVAGLVG